MSCRFMVMTAFEDGVTDGVVIRDVYAAFVGEDTGFVLPVGEARAKSEGNRAVHRLEGLEYEGVVRGGRLDSVSEGGVNYSDKERRWE